MVTIPCYEVRSHEKNEWHEITDIEMMDGLYKFYDRATPVIKEMLKGKVWRGQDAVYRLIWKVKNS